ncbi:Imm32 family immunity protein [Streptomyces vinaceus]|uniref:Imm32 family immunity protein n=1 Tax=Streptomyces vinaceus TaxID=1960 RepID=UPI0036C34608
MAEGNIGEIMLYVLVSDATAELELSGSRAELYAFGRQVRGGLGETALSHVADPAPYSRSLARVVFRQADAAEAVISVLADGETLEVRGGPEALAYLAANIEGFAEDGDATGHLHLEYPGHDYLAEESDPLVVALDEGVSSPS